MAQRLDTQHYTLLDRLGNFPTERLKRCGATAAQLTSFAASWAAKDYQTRAELGQYLATLPDAAITATFGSFPPAVPSSVSSTWPYV